MKKKKSAFIFHASGHNYHCFWSTDVPKGEKKNMQKMIWPSPFVVFFFPFFRLAAWAVASMSPDGRTDP